MSKLSNLEFFKLVAGNGDVGSAESRFIYPPAIAKTLGFKLLEVAPGTATMEIVADTDKHANPMGTIHGGVLCDIADAAIGTAHATSLEEGESFTSLDLQIYLNRLSDYLFLLARQANQLDKHPEIRGAADPAPDRISHLVRPEERFPGVRLQLLDAE